MSPLSYYFKTFNYPTTFSHCKSNHCHTAAFCQKIILEFVARCRWNGKKYFWATLLLKPSILLRSHCRILPEKKIISHFKTTELTLVCDRKILNSAKSCLFKLVLAKLLICLLKLISIDFCLLDLTIIPGNISDLKSRNLDNTQIFPSLIKWVRGSNPGSEEEVLIAN